LVVIIFHKNKSRAINVIIAISYGLEVYYDPVAAANNL